jgi:hypothetical protein
VAAWVPDICGFYLLINYTTAKNSTPAGTKNMIITDLGSESCFGLNFNIKSGRFAAEEKLSYLT